jgi:hypothetical protein
MTAASGLFLLVLAYYLLRLAWRWQPHSRHAPGNVHPADACWPYYQPFEPGTGLTLVSLAKERNYQTRKVSGE